MADSSSKLQRLRFAQLVFAGVQQAEAARQAGYKAGPGLAATASRMMRDGVVQGELARLQKLAEKDAIAQRAEAERLLTADMRASFALLLTDAGTLDPAALKKYGHLLKSVTVSDKGIRVELQDRHGAIDRLAKLNGWYKPEKTEVEIKGPKPEEMTDAELAAELARMAKELQEQDGKQKAEG